MSKSQKQHEEEITPTENTMRTLISVYNKYAKIEGDRDLLSTCEAKKLIENELPMFAKLGDKQVEKILRKLDQNKDGTIDFEEFVSMVACMTKAYRKFFESEEHCT
ncbi:protein S100-A6-like [Protopterus annectens]|uniref:protein S100-A6-like n=1 Tax=Protopterus annectens TaxID=7888 RepID=UPI001CFB2493|nr:protein S100-A6-like [Protopterus annectens]